MRLFLTGLVAGGLTIGVIAQTKINPTDPQPTCAMCPGYYIPAEELRAYTQKAVAEKLTDQQVRDIEIGKAHIGIGMVHRGKLDKPLPDSVAEHDQVSEVYYIIEGTATLMLGPDITNRQRRPATLQTVREFNGPGQQRLGDQERRRPQPQGRRRGGDPRRHRPLVHEDRRPRRLHDGAHRSRQGHAAQGRGGVQGVSGQAGAAGVAAVTADASVDVLVFGPHPDDIEIGLGGTIALHTAAGPPGRAVRSDGRRAVEQRHAGAAAGRSGRGRRRPGRRLAREPRLARWRHRARRRRRSDRRSTSSGALARAPSPCRTGTTAIPITSPAATCCASAAFRSGLRRYESADEAWRPDWLCYYFINDSATPSFVVDVSAHYQRKREALDCYRSQFAPREGEAVATRLTAATFRQLIESRDAQFGALAGVAFAEGIVVREPVRRSGLLKHAP